MNKLDKQFEEMIKGGTKLDSPSSDFTLKVMSWVYAEAAVKPKRILQDYEPVISKKAWTIIIAAFVLLLAYVMVSGQNAPETDNGLLSNFFGKLGTINNAGATSALQTGMGIFKTIPPVAYLIVISALGLWTLDSVLQRLRQNSHQTDAN